MVYPQANKNPDIIKTIYWIVKGLNTRGKLADKLKVSRQAIDKQVTAINPLVTPNKKGRGRGRDTTYTLDWNKWAQYFFAKYLKEGLDALQESEEELKELRQEGEVFLSEWFSERLVKWLETNGEDMTIDGMMNYTIEHFAIQDLLAPNNSKGLDAVILFSRTTVIAKHLPYNSDELIEYGGIVLNAVLYPKKYNKK